jgi:ABC-type nitrate/sulfonate/bicarbonate transport system substrate-binding protein
MKWLRYALAVLALLASYGPAMPPSGAATLVPVRIILDPTFYTHLPLLRALDMGYFKDEGIDLQITPANGSSTLFLPMLARGDYDLGTVNPSPAFFNQFNAGFNVVILAAQTGSKPGWHDVSWMMVRQDLWDAKTIAQPADLKGKVVDGANVGSPVDFLLKETIRTAGLTPADMRVGERFRSIDNWLEALRNKAADVLGATEPAASEIDKMGVAHRWVSFSTIAPWYQLEYIGASAKFAKEHPDLITKFLRGYLRGNNDVLKSNGKWTPALLAEAAKWSTLTPDVLRLLQGPAYPSLHGEVNLDALTRMQQFWINEKLVKEAVDVNQVVNLSALRDAQKSLHY